ncbi:gamma-glutamylaminecyclotransferase-like isoform X2 [Nelusetta ayraudi]|uniref:gamma-glutamylaminecyclotransferase-like isoform X2 n=1 Tax=Nelusetta ayraudi TaxID=303726 RepID=UPI003F71AD0C
MLSSVSARMTQIFVYGTLKRGQPNHYRMLDSANGEAGFLSTACTVQKFPLVIAGPHNVPFLLDVPGQGHRIQGELYTVDERMLAFLDDFEMVPTWYQRVPVELQVERSEGGGGGDDGATAEAFVYIRKAFEEELLRLCRFESYDAYGDHGLQYVDREARD